MPADIADPRTFPDRIDAAFAPQLELAAASLASTRTALAAELDVALSSDMARALGAGNASWLAGLLAAAPSPAIARHLWRRLIAAWGEASRSGEPGLAVTLFAMPVVIVAGRASDTDVSVVDAVLPDSGRVRDILLEHGALAGNRAFGLSNALVACDALDVPRLAELIACTRLRDAHGAALPALTPAAIALAAGEQTVHLRFIIGTALAARDADLVAESRVGSWGLPLAQELARQLATPGVSVLALPRGPRAPLIALQEGRAAQREIGAQLFASNAIRRLRASVGEPAAVVSAHRCPGAFGGGELRLSLSSVFDPRQAEGFRCPVFPGERVGDVATGLVELLRDCRVADIHVLSAAYPDRDPQTGLTLLFKAEAIADARPTALQ